MRMKAFCRREAVLCIGASVLLGAVVVAGSLARAGTIYDYDTQHRLVRVLHDNGQEVRYEYDASGNRARRFVRLLGDTEPDGDLDLVDFSQAHSCLVGSGPDGQLAAGCKIFDFDDDGDIDLRDIAWFQAAFTGGR